MGITLSNIQTGLLNQSSSQAIDGSLRFDSRKSQSLTRTPGSAGNRKTWTYSSWVKTIPGALAASNHKNLLSSDNGNANNNERMHLFLGNASDKIQHDLHSSSPRVSTANYRDVSGWYHVVVKFDTTKSAAREQIAWYINGEQVVNWDTEDALSQNTDYGINGNWLHRIGSNNAAGPGQFWDGHMSQVYLIDGLALGPGYFGFTDPLTGVWRPKKFRAEGTTVNNGRVFSSTGTFTNWDDDGSYPKTELFDGTLYTGGTPNGACPDDGNPASFDFGDRRITGFQNLQINIFISSNQASATNLASVNGIDITNEIHEAGNNTWTTVDLGSKFTTLQSFTIKNNNCYVGGFIIDGVVMQDSTTQNLDFGTNGFYLPMDGNSPIGQDKSGKGNDWKPVNFGGSAGVDQATGALPILEGAGGAVANVATRTDANAANLVLALPLVGSANDVSNRINSGTTSKTVTVNGAVASSSYSNFYGGSYYFDGSDNITVADGSNHFSFGTGAYTVEGYLYPTTLTGNGDANPRFFCCGTPSASSNRNQLQIVITASGQIRLDTNGANYTSTAGDVVANRWQHIAVVRDGSGNLKAFVDGRQVLSQTSVNNDITNNDGISLGIEAGHSSRFTGYMNDVRIYKGVAKYTSNFIPASTNPDILPDSPSGVSGKSKLTKITDGAVSFEGTATSKLTLADSTDFTFGVNNFCIEFYYYNNSLDGSYNIIFDCMGSNRSGIQLAFETDGDYRIEVGDGSNNWIWQSTGFDAKAKQWTHFALTREGSTFRAFENGVLLGTQTSSTAVGDPRSPAIGGYASDDSTNYGFNGYISNFRIVNGSAVYTAAFTPPERTLTNVTNTKLLCCQSNTEPGGAAVAPSISGINNGTQWSKYLTGAGGFQSSYPAINAFNGTASASETSRSTNNGETQIFAPPTGIPYSSKVEVWTYYQGTVSLNSGTGVSVSDDQNWREIATGSGTLNSLVFSCNSGNSMYLAGIRIDSTTILLDPVAPKGNAAATNFNPFNTSINTVRGQETGYCTLNPLDSIVSLRDGNLETANSSGWQSTRATIGMSSGKFYWETQNNQDAAAILGISNEDAPMTSGLIFGSDANPAWAWAGANYYFNSSTAGTSLSNHGTSDIVQYAFDADNGKLWFGRNGIWYNSLWATTGDPANGLNPTVSSLDTNKTYFACASFFNGSAKFNFGQKPFRFPPPDGFQPINGTNILPDKVFARPDKYFANSTWTGNGVTGRLINIGMQPDMVWYKMTNNNVQHELYDSVRGANKGILIGKNTQQFTYSNRLLSFVHNGFTVGDAEQVNENPTKDYVGWSWKAGGNKGTFNVDDVGYANASDVNMSVGSLNTAAYDDSIVWSSNYTGTAQPTQAFDGTGPKQNGYAHQSGGLTITFPGGGLSGRIIVYGGTGGGGADTYTLSDGSSLSSAVQYDTSPYYEALDFGVKSSITSLVCSPGYTLYGIRVDGKLLVDNGVTPPNAPSIAPSACSVGTKQGFSIIKYTGSGSNGTIPHGLSQEPDFFFGRDLEDTSGSRDWIVYHKIMGNTGRLKLVGNASISESSAFFNTSGPTNNLISVGTSTDINSTNDYIMYCWHNVPGLQKFGGYTGNGSDDGPFVETGFRPALVWTRAYSANSNNNSHWLIYDSRINTYNESSQVLYINLENGVNTHASMGIDILSNGFKLKADSSGYSNYNGWSYIYCAWAEAPAFNLYGAQSNAR